jgi:hypothetical protein
MRRYWDEMFDDWDDREDADEEYWNAWDEAYSEYMRQQDEEEERLRALTPVYALVEEFWAMSPGVPPHE